ncbi:CRISPR type III-A/MTUBE-associated RAMP protein Csm5 [Rubellimicrobium thermophilum DSM 16684]|uniref:CRISPR system Cms protein Csm5 n=1 Tax=Rubellimicrobium thermophilum DSM 16684 TaxID=1123069 RepID=S9QXK7_9RHOB|nr:type III-A CRISPR-associated RAMP protein Csm5 [Rubellimicrobium thermophilum]EPX84342.1 CRISPR type III-A/MTUBE-associated RAMP protein Csm5 [Rubellimicrobium thermophilum DSM 16684]
MSGAQFVSHHLVLVPLTPLHIGGGEEAQLLPQDYSLRDGHAERLDIRRVLARLPEAERAAWIAAMAGARDSGGVVQAVRSLQAKATPAEVIERIPISDASARETDLAGEGRDRRNRIDAFFRAGGQPVLPGSSLKGALRTAWAADMVRRTKPQPKSWKALESELFALDPGNRAQDTDPFRDVAVADAPLPEGATRIDPVATWKRQGEAGGYGFGSVGQMHRERMRSVADGGAPPVIALRIGLRDAAFARAGESLAPDRRPQPDRLPGDIEALLAALEAHHAPLWRREVEEKFFAGPPGERLRQALRLFAGFARGGAAPEAALIRLGWATHAEAKSLAGLRRIERPQARGADRFAAEGSARHVVNLAGHPLPFGWALLIRQQAWEHKQPKAWLPPPAARLAAAPAGGGRGATPADPPRADGAGAADPLCPGPEGARGRRGGRTARNRHRSDAPQ